MSHFVTVEPNGNEQDSAHWLGIRTQPQTYCADCGEAPEWCHCDEQPSAESAKGENA